ncbi:MAG: hypothetical protein HY924_03785 [Elusimicrobia bacterium]|nr:hypothetical protein [Elusimicrobiota bacterium]
MKPGIPWVRALLILLAVEFAGLRPGSFGTGWHLDDWYEVSLTVQGPEYADGVRGFADAGIYWDRPLNMLLLPLVHRLSGVSSEDPLPARPWVPQTLLAFLEAGEGLLLFLLLERLLGSPGLALTAAGLALLFPNRAGLHFRPGLIGQQLSQVLMLASMLAHLRWRESGRSWFLAAGAGLYAGGLLVFETPMLAPLLLAGALAGRSWAESGDPGKAAREAARCLAPYAAVLAAVVLWKFAGLRFIPEAMNQKSEKLSFSVSNAAKVLAAGMGCTTLWPLTLSCLRLRDALAELGRLWLVLPFFAVWAALTLRSHLDRGPIPGREVRWTLAGAAAFGFVGTYAPFMVSAHHMPYVNGILSRVNGVSAWVGGLWLAAGVVLLPGRWRGPCLGLLLAAFTWTNWVEARAWARAWEEQKEILSSLVPQVRGLAPGPSSILLQGAARTVHGATVFDSNYDLGWALRMLTQRPDLRANVLGPDMEVRGANLVQTSGGVVTNSYPLAVLRVYDHRTRRLGPAEVLSPPPPVKRSVLFKLLFGPGMDP